MVAKVPVDGHGFLSESVAEKLIALPGCNAALMKVAIDAARLSDVLIHQLHAVRPHLTVQDKQRVIALTIFVRFVECYESILILAANGVRQELRTLLRVLLDAYFVLANVCSRAEFIGDYFRSDDADRNKLLNAIQRHDHELFHGARDAVSPEERQALTDRIKEDGVQPFRSYANAAGVGCAVIYDSLYRLCSPSVHTGPRIIDEYLQVDDDGTATRILHTSSAKETDRYVFDATHYVSFAMKGLLECFEESVPDELHRIFAELAPWGEEPHAAPVST